MQRKRHADQTRIEPRTTPFLKRIDRILFAAAGGEDIQVLCDRADPRQQWNLLAFHAVRVAAAVPVLIEAADSLRGEFAHAQFGDDAGATIAADADHLLIVLVLRKTDMKNSGNPGRSAGAWKNVLPKQLQS